MGIEPISETLQVFLAEALEHASPLLKKQIFRAHHGFGFY
jgi:hypothetical protein